MKRGMQILITANLALVCLFLVVALVLCLTGCQPTPEVPTVVQKDLEQMLETAQQPPAAQPGVQPGVEWEEVPQSPLINMCGIPDVYQNEFTGATGKLTVRVDARPEVPTAARIPIVRVAAENFSQELIDGVIAAVFGGGGLYAAPASPADWGKDRWALEIAYHQRVLEDMGEPDWRRESAQNAVVSAMQRMDEAPETVPVESDGKLAGAELFVSTQPGGCGGLLHVTNDVYDPAAETKVEEIPGEGGGWSMDTPMTRATMRYERDPYAGRGMPQVIAGGSIVADATAAARGDTPLEGSILTTPPAQAVAQVEAFLQAAGIAQMRVDTVTLVSSYMSPDVLELEVSGGRVKSAEAYYANIRERQAYEVRCLRVVEGVKVSSDAHIFNASRTEDSMYAKEWYYEQLLFHVDDDGIGLFTWTAPLQLQETLVQDAALLPFGEIRQIFEKMFMVHYEQGRNEESEPVEWDISKVVLSLHRVAEKGSYTTGLLIPVWIFYLENDVLGNFPALMLNAVDGSVIDPQLGY